MFKSAYDKEIENQVKLLQKLHKEHTAAGKQEQACRDNYYKLCDEKTDKSLFQMQAKSDRIEKNSQEWNKANKSIDFINSCLEVVKDNLKALYRNKLIDFFNNTDVSKYEKMPVRYKKFKDFINTCFECYSHGSYCSCDFSVKVDLNGQTEFIDFYLYNFFHTDLGSDECYFTMEEKERAVKNDFVPAAQVKNYVKKMFVNVAKIDKEVEKLKEKEKDFQNKFFVGNKYNLTCDFKKGR